MSSEIKSAFSSHLDLEVTPKLAQQICGYLAAYEARGEHPLAFNEPYIGIHKCYFNTQDRDNFFDIFDIEVKGFVRMVQSYCKSPTNFFGIDTRSVVSRIKDWFTSLIKSPNYRSAIQGIAQTDLRRIINEISSVDSNWNTVSDPLNLFATYVLYKTWNSSIPETLKYNACFALIMILQYKFFTSLVNHRIHYTPDIEIAMQAFESLNAKWSIKRLGSWKKVMAERAELFLSKDNIHTSVLESYDDDKEIVYFITDTQTRVRTQVNLVMQEFMLAKEKADKIGSYSSTGLDNDGEMVFMDNNSTLDTVVSALCSDCLSVTRFVEEKPIRLVANLFTNISKARLRAFLIAFSEKAVKQVKAGQQELVKVVDGEEVDVGVNALIRNLLQKTFRYCAFAKTNMKSPPAILKTAKDVYSSSRIQDAGIVRVRNSVAYVTSDLLNSEREATQASYRIGFILYILILSFKYNK